MKWIAVVALLLVSFPAWSARNITVAELKDMLQTMHRESRGDADVANALKQAMLSEQLTRPAMNSLADQVPGPLSTEQLYVLEARSAMLPPPSTDIPDTPAPDAAAQQNLLDKAAGYAANTYKQLPPITATKTTLRFQDNVEAVSSSGLTGSAKDVSVGSAFVPSHQFVHYINSTDMPVTSRNGAERLPEDKTRWGANRMIAIREPDPNLAQVFADARDSGTMKFLRWEHVNGKPAAVFAFQVPKKKSHFAVNVCCFPSVEQAGTARFTSATGAGMPGGTPGQGGATGNLQINADWHPFKTVAPFHGEFFIDPATGIVVRMITQPELRANDVVHQQDTRIDYAPVTIGKGTFVLPVRTIVITEVVPNGESGAGGYNTRCTLFTSEYKNYELAGAQQ